MQSRSTLRKVFVKNYSFLSCIFFRFGEGFRGDRIMESGVD